MSTFVPPTYRTKNWPKYNKALKQRGSLTIWFNPEVTWKAEPTPPLCQGCCPPVLPDLLGQIGLDQEIGSVTADGAYDTRKCHEAIAARNAQAAIPPRMNAKPWKPGAVARNEAIRSSHYLGETLWRNLTKCHRRSRVETNPRGIMLRITLPGSGCIV